MLDLTIQGVKDFWQQRGDLTIMQIIVQMEQADTWALDGNVEFEAMILQFSKWLSEQEKFTLTSESNLIKLLVSLKTGRALRVLQYIDQLQPGSASKLLIYAEVSGETDELAKFFLQRNLIFERMQLLSRVFSPVRFKLIMDAFEKADQL